MTAADWLHCTSHLNVSLADIFSPSTFTPKMLSVNYPQSTAMALREQHERHRGNNADLVTARHH
jgi:hypothetical protein